MAAIHLGTGQPLGGTALHTIRIADMDRCTNGPTITGDQCHPVSFGRLASIDPGDMVFVQAIDGRDDVETAAKDGKSRYGAPGDAILFLPWGGSRAATIMHRALFWIEVEPDGTASIPELGISHASTLSHPEVVLLTGCTLAMDDLRSGTSGFVTRGDNNAQADQCAAMQTIPPEWILGKARGELPCLGLPILLWGDFRNGTNDFENAPQDSKWFLAAGSCLAVAGWAWRRRVRSRPGIPQLSPAD